MDALIAAAARALAAGDVLGALQRVALHEAPAALALRGIAMAQLGEYARSRELLRRAARAFGAREALARARCVVAEAEVALAMRDLAGAPRTLAAAVAVLEAHGDRANALQARLVALRRLLLLGRLAPAAQALAALDLRGAPPALLAVAELALRGLRPAVAQAALARAEAAAQRAGIVALQREVAVARAALERPAARRVQAGEEQPLRLAEVAAWMASDALVVDGCRRAVVVGGRRVPLARRPVLFVLAQALARAWPGDVDRRVLIEAAFRLRDPDETHRARLRVEIGRLRALVAGLAGIEATARGYRWPPPAGREVVLLAPPVDGAQGALLALLADGMAWSTSALALATGRSQRSVQRALAELAAAGRVHAAGQARARRWLAPGLAGFATILLLPVVASPD
ncbi:helix-turn-helix domain-containing protein [Caldimonas thermodepolymerans]|uniref:helix-turn-helix domain-containing protein n=1 Tax=Caldimonas thermodepolymerans TaxID=215580 RepID=UPI0022362564|nr:helix-turn-helix domain-containing protein [Caldimonas thermodepolymerans]UZG45281.1 helix-turn-helix domain-containing protein [Caldimonas thermodepolymerans]